MKTYALIQYGLVHEIFQPITYDMEIPDWMEGDPSRIGKEIPIEERFPASLLENMVDITDEDPQPKSDWSYDSESGVFSPPSIGPSTEDLAIAARAQRDYLLRSIYDVGILMAQRALRMAITAEEKSYAEGKIIELDNYAENLQDVPEQARFPQTIDWPIAPER